MKIVKGILCLVALAFCLSAPALAAPQQRGFQVALEDIDQDLVDELADTWHVNLVRIQIGDNETMDGLTGDDYVEMMERKFDLFDAALPLFAARNIKVVFALYSPPGGFETRVAPSHYQMFSQAALQADYLDMLRVIANRYKDNPYIYALDLLNEPAMRKEMVSGGAKTWNELLPDAIAAVREIAPNSVIMVKSLYGDPSKLAGLPELNFTNLIYSYHAYPYGTYQHTGVESAPFSVARPTDSKVSSKLYGLLARFLFKQDQRFKKKKIPEATVRLNVGEAAVSACATEGGEFMQSLLNVFESPGPGKKKKKRRGRKAPPLTYKDFIPDVEHESYTIHAFNEARIWDPRTVCSSGGDLSYSTGTTDRGAVLQSFFSRNP